VVEQLAAPRLAAIGEEDVQRMQQVGGILFEQPASRNWAAQQASGCGWRGRCDQLGKHCCAQQQVAATAAAVSRRVACIAPVHQVAQLLVVFLHSACGLVF